MALPSACLLGSVSDVITSFMVPQGALVFQYEDFCLTKLGKCWMINWTQALLVIRKCDDYCLENLLISISILVMYDKYFETEQVNLILKDIG